MSDLLSYTIAAVIGIVAVGRATRLVVHDDWPPMMGARVWIIRQLVERWGGRGETWSKIVTCPFCFAPYAAAVNLTWFLCSGAVDGRQGGLWAGAWWVVNVWAAIAYLSAILVVFDEPADH